MHAIGIDIGTTNTKTALVNVEQHRPPTLLRLITTPTPTSAGGLLAAIEAAVRELCLHGHPKVVGIASMAESGVPLDADGVPLTPIVSWSDRSAQPVVDDLATRLGRRRAFDLTGVRISAKPPLAKWLWLRRHQPQLWQAMRWWAGTADLVAYALIGSMVTDHTLAGRTGAWELETHRWWPQALAVAGLTEDRLAHVQPIGQAAGVVRPGPFAAAGLPVGTPVVVAGHDHAVGAYAADVRTPGSCADSLGTAEAVYTVLDALPAGDGDGSTDVGGGADVGGGDGAAAGRADVAACRADVADEGMSLVRTVAGDRYAVVGGAPSAGALIGWWRSLGLPVPGDVSPDPSGPVALPYLTGRQCPSPSPAARLVFDGIGPGDSTPELFAGLLLGLSLHARWIMETHQRWLDRPIETVTVLGGPSVNDSWVHHKAAVGPAPINRATTPDAVVLGAAMIAAERGAQMRPRPLPAEPVHVDRDVRFEDCYWRFVELAQRR